MASYVPCKKNDANGYIFYVSLVSQADTKIMQANPTLAAGDVKIAVDDAAPGNLGTLPVVDADFTKRVKVTLSQAETNGDNLTIIFSDASGAEWCDLTINIQTSAQTLDEIETDVAATHVHAAGAETQATAAATDAAAAHVQADHIHDTDLPAVKAETALIVADTAEIGTAGAGLTAIPWNAIWDAEVQSECADALVAYDPPTKAELDTAEANIRGTDSDTLKTLSGQLDTAQADLDNPNQYKADVSSLALEATAQSIKAKTDLLPADTATQLDTNIPAIKAKTDLIPADISTQLDTNVPAIKAQTDKFLFDVSNFVKSIAQNSELAHLDADISTREVPAHVTAEIDDLITRVKGLDAIYDSVALRALEATLTAIKGAGWTTETLKAIKDAIDALVTGGATAQEVWEYVTRTLTATPESFVV